MTVLQCIDNEIPDAVYNPDADRIEIVDVGGRVVFSLSILDAAMLNACISKAQTVGFKFRLERSTDLDSGSSPERRLRKR